MDSIEITDRQRERFETIKAECSNRHLPAPTDQQLFDSLLDTFDGVGRGMYSNPDYDDHHLDGALPDEQPAPPPWAGDDGGDS